MKVTTTDDVPKSLERLADYDRHYVLLVPVGASQTRSTAYGERPIRNVKAWVYNDGEAYDLGEVPVFPRAIIAALDRAASEVDGVVFGMMTKEKRVWAIRYTPGAKEDEKALKVLQAAYSAWDRTPERASS